MGYECIPGLDEQTDYAKENAFCPRCRIVASSMRCLGNGNTKIKNALETFYVVKIETISD